MACVPRPRHAPVALPPRPALVPYSSTDSSAAHAHPPEWWYAADQSHWLRSLCHHGQGPSLRRLPTTGAVAHPDTGATPRTSPGSLPHPARLHVTSSPGSGQLTPGRLLSTWCPQVLGRHAHLEPGGGHLLENRVQQRRHQG